MKSHNIALRAQDFQEALKETSSFGPKEVHFRNTILIGKAASLSMHLKGLNYIEDIDGLMYAAAELGITSIELEIVLRQLEEVDFISVIKSGTDIKRVDIRVPVFRNAYEDLGNLWSSKNPTETEKFGVELLDKLLISPIKEEIFVNTGLSPTGVAILKDVMTAGQLIKIEPVSGEKIVYSPLAVDANPINYLKWAERHTDSVANLVNTLNANQGIPISSSLIPNKETLEDAILTGVLMPVRIIGATGEQNFIFSPKGGLNNEERVIMDKARALLACVRYGQNFAAGTPIKYPRSILTQLRSNKRFAKGHPDLYSQYGILVEKLVGRPVKEGSNKWNLEIIDTDENLKALDVAIDMLEMGASPTAHLNLEAQKAIISPHGYQGPTSTRPRLATVIQGSAATRAEIVTNLISIARGVSDD
ncbi:hypothetical protein Ga0466249_004071 [Sporomusaceae bacterium BoRhaA]|uniref:hypothetical protein n=1 Tax=Pelorhabdus rhamnosifermentans TaxID=2772457 RepID=UPI001C05F866|nr:hypothetical protein [Pelorhabdus rhamnosifermentans]MBU2702936.1 hypothetical protein [Pelorhabdus rhamnosifermentans]